MPEPAAHDQDCGEAELCEDRRQAGKFDQQRQRRPVGREVEQVKAGKTAEFAREIAARPEDAKLISGEGEAQADGLCDAKCQQVMAVQRIGAPQQQRIDAKAEGGVRRTRHKEPQRAPGAVDHGRSHESSHNGIRIFSRSTSRGRKGDRSSNAGDVIRPSG